MHSCDAYKKLMRSLVTNETYKLIIKYPLSNDKLDNVVVPSNDELLMENEVSDFSSKQLQRVITQCLLVSSLSRSIYLKYEQLTGILSQLVVSMEREMINDSSADYFEALLKEKKREKAVAAANAAGLSLEEPQRVVVIQPAADATVPVADPYTVLGYVGKPKGIAQVLHERGLWHPDMVLEITEADRRKTAARGDPPRDERLPADSSAPCSSRSGCLVGNSIYCTVPVSENTNRSVESVVTLRVATADMSYVSELMTIALSAVPVVSAVELDVDRG
eukprot:gene44453-55286_t